MYISLLQFNIDSLLVRAIKSMPYESRIPPCLSSLAVLFSFALPHSGASRTIFIYEKEQKVFRDNVEMNRVITSPTIGLI